MLQQKEKEIEAKKEKPHTLSVRIPVTPSSSSRAAARTILRSMTSRSDSSSCPISRFTMPIFSACLTTKSTPTTVSVSTSPKSTSKSQIGLSELFTSLEVNGLERVVVRASSRE